MASEPSFGSLSSDVYIDVTVLTDDEEPQNLARHQASHSTNRDVALRASSRKECRDYYFRVRKAVLAYHSADSF